MSNRFNYLFVQMKLHQTYLQQPEELPEKWVDAWNRRDAEALANLFTEDAEFVNVVGLWWHNRKDIWKAHDYGLRVIFNDSTLELRKTTCKYIGNGAAVVHARMKLSGQSQHGDVTSPLDRKNIFSFVIEKKEQGWVCVSAHNTDVVPGKETNLIGENGEMKSVDYRK